MASREGVQVSQSVVAQRLASQLLSGPPASSVGEVATHLLAIQAQDLRGARLAFRARARGLTAADVDRALSDERSVVLTTLNRGTLHLVTADDYLWVHALTAPTVTTANATRLRQEGVSAEQSELGVATIARALEREGPLTRRQLSERLQAAGIPVEGQALPHLLMLASLRGLTVRGPIVGRDQAHVLVRDWLGRAPKTLDRDVALAELARRFLRGHGPATERDLEKWSGLSRRDVRRGLALTGSALREQGSGLFSLRDGRAHGPLPKPLLLGAFDPLLHGWVSRAPILGEKGGLAASVVTVNGIFRPFALVNGRAAATWAMPAGRVVLRPFGRLKPDIAAALADEAREVERFLGSSENGASDGDAAAVSH